MSYTRETWAEKVLKDACGSVTSAQAGASRSGRHDALFKAAVEMATYVRDGAVGANRVESELIASWMQVTQGREKEGRRVISDGLKRDADKQPWYPMNGEKPLPRTSVLWKGREVRFNGNRPALESAPVAEVELPVCELQIETVRMTWYASLTTNQGEADDWLWSEITEAVQRPRPWPTGGKDDLPLWNAAQVENDNRATRDDGLDEHGKPKHRECKLDRVHALVLDYDDDPTWSLARCREWWGGVQYIAHTSAHHGVQKATKSGMKPAGPRGRIMIALSRPVTESEYTRLGQWVLGCGRGIVGRPELVNGRRMFFVPATPPQGYEYDTNLIGKALDVERLLVGLSKLEEEFTAEAESTAPDDGVWKALDVKVSEKGGVTVMRHLTNACRILRSDPRWVGRLAYCEFSDRVLFDGEGLTDRTVPAVSDWFGTVYQLHVGPEVVLAALTRVADEHRVHPLRDYLRSVKWDGQHRLMHMLRLGFGCIDTVDGLTRAIGRRWAISCVARVMRPGCKADVVLIIVGEQGARKSSAFRVLVGEQWFGDSALDLGDMVRAYMGIRGKWVYELAELESLRSRESTTIKSFLSSPVDSYVRKHGRVTEDHPRQTVFVGTTNEEAILRDPTGARRFWVRQVATPINLEWLRANRDQLWAEAVYAFDAGEQWWLTDEEDAGRRDVEWEHSDADAWTDVVLDWCIGRDGVTAAEVAVGALKMEIKDVTQAVKTRIGGILRSHGWTGKQDRAAKTKARRWYRPPPKVVSQCG